MLRCREVVDLVATESCRDAPLGRRLALALHLAMCRYCRSYALQLRRLRAAARRHYGALAQDDGEERRLVDAVRQAAERARRS